MCGRFTQDYTWEEVFDFYNLTGPALNLRPSYNVAPTQTVHMLGRSEQGLTLGEARWGLIPAWWKKPLKDLPSTFNARAETAAEKPMFRAAFKQRRCVIPSGGFYEWKRSGSEKQPYFIYRADGTPLSFAGLWERWDDPESGKPLLNCTILTIDANDYMRQIHTRMPVVLERDGVDAWLASADAGLLVPCNDNVLTSHPVKRAVGNVRNNSPDLRERADVEA